MNAYNSGLEKTVSLYRLRVALRRARAKYLAARRMIGKANKLSGSASKSFAMKFFNKARRVLLDIMIETKLTLA